MHMFFFFFNLAIVIITIRSSVENNRFVSVEVCRTPIICFLLKLMLHVHIPPFSIEILTYLKSSNSPSYIFHLFQYSVKLGCASQYEVEDLTLLPFHSNFKTHRF